MFFIQTTNSQFTKITSIEQRRQYKTEFDNDYTEYMRLHAENERVSKRFAQLEESLRSEENNDQRYKVGELFTPSFSINNKFIKKKKFVRHVLGNPTADSS